jgi:hypothetical protein
MKKQIADNGSHATFMELKPINETTHKGWLNFRITTTYADSKNPMEEHVKYDVCLDPQAIKNLKEFVNAS